MTRFSVAIALCLGLMSPTAPLRDQHHRALSVERWENVPQGHGYSGTWRGPARALAPAVEAQAGGVSRALNNLVNCYEPVVTPRSVTDSLNALLLRTFRITVDAGACTLWRTRFATPGERAPVHSDIPTLILAGEFDARTPVEHARRIASTLSRAYVYEIPSTGHSGDRLCMQGMTYQFLNDPMRPPDASCLERIPRLSFPTRWEQP